MYLIDMVPYSHEVLDNVKDLIEFDYIIMKVLLYMCPHKELGAALQEADPILSTSFYIWHVNTVGQELVKDKDCEVWIFPQTCL